jgi:hypothetical protein
VKLTQGDKGLDDDDDSGNEEQKDKRTFKWL